MKKIKLGLAAISVLFGMGTLSSFKVEKRRSLFIVWFIYTGTVFTAAAYNNASNYTNVGTNDPDCGGTSVLCAIQAQSTSTGGKPVLFSTFGTKVLARQGHNTITHITSATTTIIVEYISL